MRTRAGLTLVEVLVSLTLVAVLAGLLLPVLAQVREGARRGRCLSNQRQLGAAVSLYLQDHDERFPQTHPTATPWSFPEDEITLVSEWRSLVQPYARAGGLFQCPSDWGAPDWHPTSYAPNGYTVYGASLAEVAAPAETLYLAELSGGSLLDEVSPWHGVDELRQTVAVERHRGRAVYLFVDGHAETLPFSATFQPRDRYLLRP